MEGTELFGTLCFLGAVLVYAIRHAPLAGDASGDRVFPLRISPYRGAFVGGMLMLAMAGGIGVALMHCPARVDHSGYASWIANTFDGAVTSFDIDLALALSTENVQ